VAGVEEKRVPRRVPNIVSPAAGAILPADAALPAPR